MGEVVLGGRGLQFSVRPAGPLGFDLHSFAWGTQPREVLPYLWLAGKIGKDNGNFIIIRDIIGLL